MYLYLFCLSDAFSRICKKLNSLKHCVMSQITRLKLHNCHFISERELTFTFAICYRPSVCRLSSVCNVRAPYSSDSNFRQYFYGIWYPSHPLTSTENFTEIVPREPLRPGELNTRGVVKYSDFGPIDGYISETVQDRRQVSINHL